MGALTYISSGNGGPVNLAPGGGAYQLIANVAAPSAGSAEYLLRLFFTGLDVSNALVISETYAAGPFINEAQASEATRSLIDVEGIIIRAGQAAVQIGVRDVSATPSGAASFTYDLYEVTGSSSASGGVKSVVIKEQRVLIDTQ